MASELSTAHLVSDLTEIEEVAEKILSDKQQMIDLDRKRNQTREAIRVLSKDKINNKCWVCVGNMFLKLPKKSTKNLLENEMEKCHECIAREIDKQAVTRCMVMGSEIKIVDMQLREDFNQLDGEINKIRTELKPQMNKLRDLENKDNLKGFHLEPLTKDEFRAIENLL